MTFKLDAKSIKDSVNAQEFYLRELNLNRLGHCSGQWAVAGLCPFHDDHKAGSFHVNITSGAFKCWSCAASGGDVISFIMQKYSLSFKESLAWLAKTGGRL